MQFPPPDCCVTGELLERNARLMPDHTVLKFDSGERFTCASLLEHVRAEAAALQALGVRQHEYVLTWLPNGPRAVTLMLALNLVGAVYVPLNTAYRGRVLQHVIASSNARLMIADGRLLDRLQDIATAALVRIVVVGDERPPLDGIELLDDAVLGTSSAADWRAPRQPVAPWHTQMVIFTSGTTGPSKGVLCSYQHTWATALEFRHVGPDDCSLVALPMFHVGGVLGIFFALIHGGCAALVQGFSTSAFWGTVRAMECTTVGLLGAMVQFLMKQPVSPDEREHPVKTAVIAPLGDDALAFAERFGIDVYTEFNMTELSVPLFCGPNPSERGTCGRPRQGVSLRLVDAAGKDVDPGATGELLVRTDDPWSMSHGYLNAPAATQIAWRDGWFHTGDLFIRDEEDNYFFVDRVKDMIRRRGENISSFEVEAEILGHPAIREVAAVAVPGDGGEDEVLAVISLVQGASLSCAELIGWLQPRLAHFMIPRYLRIIDELPKTPTQKVEKHVLRDEGVTAATWDREQAGIRIRRERLDRRQT